MSHSDVRIVKPPIDAVTSGRVFRPTNAFIMKKILKASSIIALSWIGLLGLFIGLGNETFREVLLAISQPLEILVIIGWDSVNLFYIAGAIIILAIGSLYTYIYVKMIEYSVIGWSKEVMPEIYAKKGIINITKKHVPFRTIVNVRTTKGIFDRIFGIGTVLIETAGGSVGAQPSGLISYLIQRWSASAFEERIEGIRFHEELRDFILKNMRTFESLQKRAVIDKKKHRRHHIFTRNTLETFKEIRDELRESLEMSEVTE